MTERFPLMGTLEEKIRQALQYAGWYPGRQVELQTVEAYYRRWGLNLSPKAKSFFREYGGIKRNWYLKEVPFGWAADFVFECFPYPKSYQIDVVDHMYDDRDYQVPSEEYQNLLDAAGEERDLVMVGEIGYTYPARVWIGESGKFYATHDYEDEVRVFDTLVSLIAYELTGQTLTSVAME